MPNKGINFFPTSSLITGVVLLVFEVTIISYWAAVHITGGILILPAILLWLGVLFLLWTGVTWIITTPKRSKTILGATIYHASSALPLWVLFNWLAFNGEFYVNRGLGGTGFNLGGWIIATILSGIAIFAPVKFRSASKK